MEECDVLVIGLGPAGAAAATAAAKTGLRVVAVDRRQADAGASRACPEFVPVPLGLHARAEHIVIQSIVGTRHHTEGAAPGTGLLPGSVVDRDAFDRALVDFSRAAGARLQRGAAITALDADECTATIGLNGNASRVHFRALVAADGHASAVARLLGLAPLQTMYTQRYRVALHVPQEAVDVWVSPRYPGGYGWLMPAGRDAVIATGMHERLAGEALDALHRQLAGAGQVGREIRGRSAGAVSVGGLRERLIYGNILFAGDAGGLAHPLTGAGIHPAVVSGEAAGRAAAEWAAGNLGAIPGYEARMRGQFGETLERARRNREPFDSAWGERFGAPQRESSGWSLVRGAFEP